MANLLVTNLKPNTIMVSFWKFGQHQRIEVPGYALNYTLYVTDELEQDFLKTVDENFSNVIIIGKTKLDNAQADNESQEDQRLLAAHEQINKDIDENINKETMFLTSDEEDNGISVTVSNPFMDNYEKKTNQKPRGRKPKSK